MSISIIEYNIEFDILFNNVMNQSQNKIFKSLLILVTANLLFMRIYSAQVIKLLPKEQDIKQINSHTWLYPYNDFIIISPFSPLLHAQLINSNSKQIFINILQLYPRNYQTLVFIITNGYGLQELVAAVTPVKQEDVATRYISLKKHQHEYRWTRKNIYLNDLEQKLDLYSIELSNVNSIIKNYPADRVYGPVIDHSSLSNFTETTITATLSDFLDYYFTNHLKNPQRIKNLALFAEIDDPGQFVVIFGQIQQAVRIVKLKITITLMLSQKWDEREDRVQVGIDEKLKLSGYRTVIKENSETQVRYALLEQKTLNQGVIHTKKEDILIITVQKP